MGNPQTRSGEFTYRDDMSWPESERWQLLDGCAYAMAPPSLAHQTVVVELAGQLHAQLKNSPCHAFSGPVGVRRPRGSPGTPDFVTEVLSQSTAGFDLIEKRQRYDDASVRERDEPLGLHGRMHVPQPEHAK